MRIKHKTTQDTSAQGGTDCTKRTGQKVYKHVEIENENGIIKKNEMQREKITRRSYEKRQRKTKENDRRSLDKTHGMKQEKSDRRDRNRSKRRKKIAYAKKHAQKKKFKEIPKENKR